MNSGDSPADLATATSSCAVKAAQRLRRPSPFAAAILNPSLLPDRLLLETAPLLACKRSFPWTPRNLTTTHNHVKRRFAAWSSADSVSSSMGSPRGRRGESPPIPELAFRNKNTFEACAQMLASAPANLRETRHLSFRQGCGSSDGCDDQRLSPLRFQRPGDARRLVAIHDDCDSSPAEGTRKLLPGGPVVSLR